MRIRARLLRLERTVLDRAPPTVPEEPPLSDEQEADRTGEHLWGDVAIDHRYPPPWGQSGSSFGSAAMRAWKEAAEEAWAAGHRKFHVGLRSFAMAVWLELKPAILEHRRTHGAWVPTGEPVRAHTLTPEEFYLLPLDERIAVLWEHRPGTRRSEARSIRSPRPPAANNPTQKSTATNRFDLVFPLSVRRTGTCGTPIVPPLATHSVGAGGLGIGGN